MEIITRRLAAFARRPRGSINRRPGLAAAAENGLGSWHTIGFARPMQNIDNNRRRMRNGFVSHFSFGNLSGARRQGRTPSDADARSDFGEDMPTYDHYI